MGYLGDRVAFEAERAKWRNVFHEGATFPAQVFRQPTGPFVFFEFGLFFTSRFFECVKDVLTCTKETTASFGVLEPDPVAYFYRQFKKYPVISFSVDDTVHDYLRQLSMDPGGSTADSVASSSERVVIVPQSLRWQIYGERTTEWAVLNCMSRDVYSRVTQRAGLLGLREVEEIVPFLRDVITVRSDKGVQFDAVEAFVRNYSNRH